MKAKRSFAKSETLYPVKKCIFPQEWNSYLLTFPQNFFYSFSECQTNRQHSGT